MGGGGGGGGLKKKRKKVWLQNRLCGSGYLLDKAWIQGFQYTPPPPPPLIHGYKTLEFYCQTNSQEGELNSPEKRGASALKLELSDCHSKCTLDLSVTITGQFITANISKC